MVREAELPQCLMFRLVGGCLLTKVSMLSNWIPNIVALLTAVPLMSETQQISEVQQTSPSSQREEDTQMSKCDSNSRVHSGQIHV